MVFGNHEISYSLIYMKLFQFLKPKPVHPTIESYGQIRSGASEQQIQSTMEWLFASLMAAGYSGNSHLVWYNDAKPDTDVEKLVKKLTRNSEPVFLYRCGGKVQSPPHGFYWRMMNEHSSMRIYQLELKDSH
ncbi:hypothetical protein CAL7716_101110 (plasmid) [Calothrix sp. PCC 7716]|nr:hypothetical protein CAL7716_101110 [Calothrix sp. PCC 7716]